MTQIKHRNWIDPSYTAIHHVLSTPWRIRLTDDLRARFVEDAPQDYFTVYQVMRLLSISRQTVWQRVKRGELEAKHVTRGRRKGLLIKVIRTQPELFDRSS